MPTIAETLKYANLQMAAEALYGFDANATPNQQPGALFTNPITATILTTGNRHASKFTQTEAEKFVAQYEVVEHISDTKTGFSGTLFRDKATNELVLSFRSTEFLDDSARDNQATNKMEIAAGGWAMGQIADMEDWYASLKSSGKIPAGSSLSVTGYSLGGHLATAFNLLHPSDVAATYTFNGAGVGKLKAGESLRAIVDRFNLQRKNADGNQIVFTDPAAKAAYDSLHQKFSGGAAPNAADIINLSNQIDAGSINPADGKLLLDALTRIKTITDEVARLTTLSSGSATPGDPTSPAPIPAVNIEATRLDYQLAVLIAQKSTQAYSMAGGAFNTAIDSRNTVNPPLANFYDIYGATYPSMVASSQLHYGVATPIFVEDQPLYRGGVILDAIKASYDAFDFKLLVNGYANNDFGDTHSLVLMVDSLNIQNALLQLVPEADRPAQSAAMTTYLKAASALKAKSDAGQGKAEGDVLEWVLDGLVNIFTNKDSSLHDGKAKNGDSLTTGNTWADETLRKNFYDQLALLNDGTQSAYKSLAGKFTLGLPDASLASGARTDFASLLSLLTLSPFSLKATTGNEIAVEVALGNAWLSEYGAWLDDQALTPAQLESGQGNYTKHYLQDRANFMAGISVANTNNTGTGKALWTEVSTSETIYFKDQASGLSLQQQNSNTNSSSGPQYLFGGTGNDNLSGSDQADHLYGGAGIDNLDGGQGNGTNPFPRSTGKNTQKGNPVSSWQATQAANDVHERQAA